MRVDIQSFRNPLDIINRHIALAALDSADIRSVHLNIIGKILLAHAQRLPMAADICSYDFS